MKKTVVVLAATTGYQTRSFGDAAATLGVHLVFATDRCDRLEDPWADRAIPVRFHDEERSVAALTSALNGTVPAGILAVGDRPARIAARAARAWGLPGNPPSAAFASRNKVAFRDALRRAALPCPAFQVATVLDDPADLIRDIRFPCVLKPLVLSGSRGVIRADDDDGFIEAFERLKRLLLSTDVRAERDPDGDRILIERFIPGHEFALEGLLTEGRLRVLAIFEKPDPLDGPFFEETIYVTPPRLPAEECHRIEAAIAAAAGAIGLWHGPVHAECRVNPDGVYVLEVAARPIGGLCSRALRFRRARLKAAPTSVGTTASAAPEVSLEELLLRHAIGEDVGNCVRELQASGVMMIPIPKHGVLRGFSGVDEAKTVLHVEDVRITAKPDQALIPLPEGKSYLGFIFARAETAGEVVAALRDAHARLQFRIDRALM